MKKIIVTLVFAVSVGVSLASFTLPGTDSSVFIPKQHWKISGGRISSYAISTSGKRNLAFQLTRERVYFSQSV